MSRRGGDELLLLGGLLLLSGALSGPKRPGPAPAPAKGSPGLLSNLPGWLPPVALLRALGVI